MKKTFAILVVMSMVIVFSFGCDRKNRKNRSIAEQQQTEQTNIILDEINREIGLPNMVNFQQKKLMKMIYELSDKEDLICYAYIKSDYQGKLMFIGKCVGFGVPFSAQYTNPQKLQAFDVPGGWQREIISQADPNGLYMPTSSSATWLMMIDPKTSETRPVYLEPEIVVSPFPLH